MCGEDDSDIELIDDDELETVPRSQSPSENTPLNSTLVEDLGTSRKGNVDDLKILVATDIHVGYGENKANRYLDSINTFEEVLQIAVEKKVDMVLLGGDLFHENHPSRDMQHRVVQLLRQYCLNDREVALEFLSDPSVNFNQSRFDRVNYEDSNLNVGLPVFTIHGNHDDMAGKGLTALDLLHEAGLVNLFGKHEDIDKFEISPLLLRKGDTRLALYGLGSQRDDRLCRAFQNESIKFLRPQAGADDWFNLFVLHQNRPKRSHTRTTGAYLPEQYIPSFFDLVVWGHEHECKKECQYVSSSDALGDGFFILQPGSTVATSLTKEEGLQKHVFMLKIRGRKFQCKPIPLQTTRQLIVQELTFDKIPRGYNLPASGIRPPGRQLLDELTVIQTVEEIIKNCNKTRGKRQPLLPLIKLKIIYAGVWADMQPINCRRLGAKFDDNVANALEMFQTKRVSQKKDKDDKHRANQPTEVVSAASVDQVISSYFEDLPWRERLTVLTHGAIGSALEAYAEDDVTAAKANREFEACITTRVNDVRRKLKLMPVPSLTDDRGRVNLDRFEDLVGADLSQMKRLVYGIGEDEDEEQNAGDDSMESDSSPMVLQEI